jgi:hypothetical protein
VTLGQGLPHNSPRRRSILQQRYLDEVGAVENVRPCRDEERPMILAIVNAAAEAYRGVIPADRWHDPYMPPDELDDEIAAGVVF